MKDDDPPGRPRTSVTAKNIEKVQDVIRKDHRLGVRAIAEMVNLGMESVPTHFNTRIEHEKGLCKNGSKNAIS